MKHELLNLIHCPACHGTLKLSVQRRNEPEVWSGSLRCEQCQQQYPIVAGMPHLYVNDEAWQPKAVEADGWATYHRDLGIYDVVEDAVDLRIPYYPEEPWISVARSFEIALGELQLSGDETILDLGAGRGWAAKEFALRGCRVVALDIVPDENVGLGRARAILDHHQVYFDRIIGDGENLPFVPQQFDLVFTAAALHHSSNLRLLCKNIAQVLKPGGRLCAINEPCIAIFTDPEGILRAHAQHELDVGINETRPNLLDYVSAIEEAGLSLTAAYPAGSYGMDEPDLRHWARSLGASPPSFSWHAIRPTLKAILHFAGRRWLALRAGTLSQTRHLLDRYQGRARLEMGLLAWQGGEIFLIATRHA